MEQRIAYVLLGFICSFVPLAVVDYLLYNAFLTNGYINNDVVGDIIGYDFTSFQQFWCTVLAALVVAVPLAIDYSTRKQKPYVFKGKERITSMCIGVLATALLLLLPFLKPSGYQRLLGLIIIVVTLLILRRKLRTRV